MIASSNFLHRIYSPNEASLFQKTIPEKERKQVAHFIFISLLKLLINILYYNFC